MGLAAAIEAYTTALDELSRSMMYPEFNKFVESVNTLHTKRRALFHRLYELIKATPPIRTDSAEICPRDWTR